MFLTLVQSNSISFLPKGKVFFHSKCLEFRHKKRPLERQLEWSYIIIAYLFFLYRAVNAAKNPKIRPGALAITIGQSRSFLKKPYPTQSVQLIPAMNG